MKSLLIWVCLLFVPSPSSSFFHTGKYTPEHKLELLGTTNSLVRNSLPKTPPKIAFFFLTTAGPKIPDLWKKFFLKANPNLFSIYGSIDTGSSHITPVTFIPSFTTNIIVPIGANLDPPLTVTNIFLRRAFEDPSNQLMIILDEGAIPLKPFWYIYHQLFYSKTNWRTDTTTLFSKTPHPIFSQFCSLGHVFEDVLKHHQWLILQRSDIELIIRFGFPTSDKQDVKNKATNQFAPPVEWIYASAIANAYRRLDEGMFGFSVSSQIAMSFNAPVDHPGRKRRAPRESFYKKINNGTPHLLGKEEYPGQCMTFVCWGEPECVEMGEIYDKENPKVYFNFKEEPLRDMIGNYVHLFGMRFVNDSYVVEKGRSKRDANREERLFLRNWIDKVLDETYPSKAMPDGVIAHNENLS